MSFFLLDTNVISELARTHPDPAVFEFIAKQSRPHISIITVHEIIFGIERLPSGSKRQADLRGFFDEYLDLFGDRVLEIDGPVARLGAQLRARAKLAGRTLSLPDALIAATAIGYGLTLATRNISDFEVLGLSLHNPWKTH